MRSSKNLTALALLGAGSIALSGAAYAQDNTIGGDSVANSTVTTNTIDPSLNSQVGTTGTDTFANETTPVPVREEEDRDFPWGLLGLLGLAGLLGRKKKNDIHVDARNDRRNV
jgi:LPXTG-motif cell wall-anchored protein